MLTIKVTRFFSRIIRLFSTTIHAEIALFPPRVNQVTCQQIDTVKKTIRPIAFWLKIRLNALVEFLRYADADFWTRYINLCYSSFYCRFKVN